MSLTNAAEEVRFPVGDFVIDPAVTAETIDGREAPVELSLKLLEALHERWIILLDSLRESDFAKSFSHPQRGVMTIDKAIQLYAWHGVHHTAHVTGLRERKGW